MSTPAAKQAFLSANPAGVVLSRLDRLAGDAQRVPLTDPAAQSAYLGGGTPGSRPTYRQRQPPFRHSLGADPGGLSAYLFSSPSDLQAFLAGNPSALQAYLHQNAAGVAAYIVGNPISQQAYLAADTAGVTRVDIVSSPTAVSAFVNANPAGQQAKPSGGENTGLQAYLEVNPTALQQLIASNTTVLQQYLAGNRTGLQQYPQPNTTVTAAPTHRPTSLGSRRIWRQTRRGFPPTDRQYHPC